jgi:hypothetical protein
LNAQGNEDAVFVLKINGAFSTSTYAKVELMNGAQAKNIFWKIDGATDINEYSEFKGTIIGNNGAVNLASGMQLVGRALTTNGSVLTSGITATMTPGCTTMGINDNQATAKAVTFYPNPFSSTLTVNVTAGGNHDLYIYSATGSVIMQKTVSQNETTFDTSFPTGIYFYKLIGHDGSIASGKLISK